ncbi:hypothetical protein [Bdellovibrio svalbardensis]|uniref:DUF5666 domain-containing protein n=1 Tax=Bdellovibrio svalbardensis TaxID=2972972 RepID=A0ABT6DDS0_9BACT|nr:hypothetical protein [Bdellovibrio svalbardensis]MDG0814987.1 hypothetical protein [Bdellovibrio svalbardensis]
MSKCKVLWTILVGFLFSISAIAADTCVSTATEFAAKSASFPQVIQKLPAMLTTDGFLVTAGLKIRTVGEKLKLEGYVWKPGEISVDDGYVTKACFDGKILNVTLENGTTYAAKVNGEKSVSIQGVDFDRSSEAKFAGIVEKIKEAQAKKSRNSNSQAGVK